MKSVNSAFAKTAVLLVLSLYLSSGISWGGARVESRSENGEPGVTPGETAGLDILRKMEFLQQEVQELRGKLEEQNYQLKQLQEHQKKLYLDLDARLKENLQPKSAQGITFDSQESVAIPATSSQMNTPTTSPFSSSTDIELPGMISSPSSLSSPSQFEEESQFTAPAQTEAQKAAEDKAYQKAYHYIQMKDYDNALLAFKSLVKSFPTGKYLPNAHYWLGEIYFARENLELASVAFEQVYKQFPQHPKAADALLKLGYVEYAKADWKRSKAHLSQVKNQFPGSTSAQLADARLQRMHREGKI